MSIGDFLIFFGKKDFEYSRVDEGCMDQRMVGNCLFSIMFMADQERSSSATKCQDKDMHLPRSC